jgi:hypothetical protein
VIDTDQMEDLEKYAPLVPIFGAFEELFDAWEQAVRELELETEPSKWTRQLNRQARRDLIHGRNEVQAGRSRIRRRINRIARKKGWYR